VAANNEEGLTMAKCGGCNYAAQTFYSLTGPVGMQDEDEDDGRLGYWEWVAGRVEATKEERG
jgi:hypothetical protein